MFRNYLAAALRNLARSRLYASISIIGLAFGICAALLSFLVIRNQLTFDRFIPGYERTYLALSVIVPPGRSADYNTDSHHTLARRLEATFREIEASTRATDQDLILRRGETRAKEQVSWVDPNFLDVVSLPVLAGDARNALRRPDGIVLPRSIARKYFGRDDVVGAKLEVGVPGQPMIVTAVIEDLPAYGTHLQTGILLPGVASWSQLTAIDSEPPDDAKFLMTVRTYVRLARSASLERMRSGLPQLARAMWPKRLPSFETSIELVRLDRVHVFPGLNPHINALIAMVAGIGLLVLFVACVNFVNLATARASRRALEVAVRKAVGASRPALIVQFLGESLLYVTLATCVAVALTELLLPSVNAFMNSGAVFEYWRDPSLIVSMAGGVVVLAILAGIYPALVLSSFRPAVALKGRATRAHGGNVTRQVLVALQFATLMSLIVAAAITWQQRLFAMTDALRVSTDQHLLLRTPCNVAFRTELQRLPGVVGAACSSWSFLTNGGFAMTRAPNGEDMTIAVTAIDAGLLELYDLKPLAGRFFSNERDSDVNVPSLASRAPTRGVINETAVRQLGFGSHAAALGRNIQGVFGGIDVIGVVPDFSVASVERAIPPTVYIVSPANGIYIDVKLRGREIPETLAAIDRLWSQTGAPEPLSRFFLNEHIQEQYLTVLRVSQWFGIMACVAVVLACLGLIGLSASTTERRTKEIGIRKAMGATRGEIQRLMVWQFIKPVLWACLIAAPVSAYLMHLWLQGFAYRIDLTPWPFLGAAVVSLAIAVLTVGTHCHVVAGARPVAALRYE